MPARKTRTASVPAGPRPPSRGVSSPRVSVVVATALLLGVIGVALIVVAHRSSAPPPILHATRHGDADVVKLIAKGETVRVLLSDGTPVWEVRHHDGTVNVFAAAAPSVLEPVSGLQVMTFWVPGERRFFGVGIYDEDGRMLGYPGSGNAIPALDRRSARDLARYGTRIQEHEVAIGRRVQGRTRRLDASATVGAPASFRDDQIVSFDPRLSRLPVVSLEEAVSRPPGTVVLADAALVMDEQNPPRLCSGGHRLDRVPFAPCPASSTTSSTLRTHERPGWVSAVSGPLFLRVDNQSVTDVVAFGNGYSNYRIEGRKPAPIA